MTQNRRQTKDRPAQRRRERAETHLRINTTSSHTDPRALYAQETRNLHHNRLYADEAFLKGLSAKSVAVTVNKDKVKSLMRIFIGRLNQARNLRQ